MTRRTRQSLVLVFGSLTLIGIGSAPRAQPPTREAERRLEEQRGRMRRLAGEILARLDRAEQLKALHIEQEIATKKAEADFEKARTAAQVAEIALDEYVKGTFPQDAMTAEGELTLAKSERARATDRLHWTKRMVDGGWISPLQLLADQAAELKARISEKTAQDKIRVLNDFTKKRTTTELAAGIERAKSEMLAREADWVGSKLKLARLEREIDQGVLVDREARALALLDQAAQTSIQWRAALAGPKPAEAEGLAANVAAALDEAERLWQEVRDAETFGRIHEAARKLPKR